MLEENLGNGTYLDLGFLLDFGVSGRLLLENQDHHLASQLLQTRMQSLWRLGEVAGVVVLLECLLLLGDMLRLLLIWFRLASCYCYDMNDSTKLRRHINEKWLQVNNFHLSLHLQWYRLHPLLLSLLERRSTGSWRKG